MSVATFSQDYLKVFNVLDNPFSPVSVSVSSKNQTHGRITWSGDGKWLAVAPVERGVGPLPIFKFTEKKLQPLKYVTLSNISSACFFNWTNRNIAVGNESGEVFVWDIKEKKTAIKVEYVEKQPVDLIAVNSDDTYIATASLNSNKISLHGLKTNKVLNTVSIPKSNHTSSLKFCMCKKNFLGASSIESTICVWDIFRSEFIFKAANCYAGACTDISFSPINYEILASVSLTKSLKMYDLRLGKLIFETNLGEPMNCVDIVLNGDKVAVGTTGGNVIIYDLRADKVFNSFKVHEGPVLSVKMQNLKIPKAYQEVEMNTPDAVDNPSKTLDISVIDILSPINLNHGREVANPQFVQNKTSSFHSTPKVLLNTEQPTYEDSFLRNVLSPLPQAPSMPPTSQSSPYLCPIFEKQEPVEPSFLSTKQIKEEPKTPMTVCLGGGGGGDGFHVDDPTQRNVYYSDIINEIRNCQKEVLSEINEMKKEIYDMRNDYDRKFKVVQESCEKLGSLLLGDIKREVYAGNCDSKIEHISHRILLNELNENIIAGVERVNEQVGLNALRLKHIFEMLNGVK